MPLVSLIYASRAARVFSSSSLVALTARASRSNAAASITGALIYCDGLFLQVLEGEERTVRTLFEKISADPCHTDVQQIFCDPISARSFGEWAMSCLHEDDIDKLSHARLAHVFARMSTAATSRRAGKEARQLIVDLAKTIRAQSRLTGVPHAA